MVVKTIWYDFNLPKFVETFCALTHGTAGGNVSYFNFSNEVCDGLSVLNKADDVYSHPNKDTLMSKGPGRKP